LQHRGFQKTQTSIVDDGGTAMRQFDLAGKVTFPNILVIVIFSRPNNV
jgi:hypothetical protein